LVGHALRAIGLASIFGARVQRRLAEDSNEDTARFGRSRRAWSLPRWSQMRWRGGSSTVLSPQRSRIVQVEVEIDRIEAQAIERLAVPPSNQVQQIELLGKLMLYDKQLSVTATRHVLSAHARDGLTGPVSS